MKICSKSIRTHTEACRRPQASTGRLLIHLRVTTISVLGIINRLPSIVNIPHSGVITPRHRYSIPISMTSLRPQRHTVTMSSLLHTYLLPVQCKPQGQVRPPRFEILARGMLEHRTNLPLTRSTVASFRDRLLVTYVLRALHACVVLDTLFLDVCNAGFLCFN
jgi:hypothetical protein